MPVSIAQISTIQVGSIQVSIAPSASTVSCLNQTLTQQFETWRERPLQEHWRIVYLDGVYFTARHGDQTDSTVLLTALGVDMERKKEVLVLRASAEDGTACYKNGYCIECFTKGKFKSEKE